MELIIESIVEALCDKTAGGVEAILEAVAEEADKVIIEETVAESII